MILDTLTVKITGDASGLTSATSKAAKAVSGLSSIDTTSTGSTLGSKMGNGISNGLSAAKVAIGNMIANAASAGINAIRDNLDDAISRVDTLNQFPKIMEQMGFSADEANDSMSRLSDGIDGLPTSLDDIVSSTQSIALLTGDLDSATDTAIALNDAFLASGSSSDEASRGLTQYTQMLSSGKVDMQSWRTLCETMGYALTEVAEEFGYTGSSAKNDLYSALQDGTITFDEFNEKLVECDTAAGGFAETAQTASAGIETSMTNVKTAITKNLANVIDEINGDEGRITNFFNGMKDVVNDAGGALTEYIGGMVEDIAGFIDAVKNSEVVNDSLSRISDAFSGMWDAVNGILGQFSEGLSSVFGGDSVGLVESFSEFIAQAAENVEYFISKIEDNGTFQTFGEAIGTVASAFGDLFSKLFEGNGSGILDIIAGALDFIAQVLLVLAEVISTVIGWIIQIIDWFGQAAETVGQVGQDIGQFVTDVQTFFTVDLPAAIDELITWFQNLPQNIWDAIIGAKDKIVEWGTQIKEEAQKAASDLVAKVKEKVAELPSKIWNAIIGAKDKIVTWGTQLKEKAKTKMTELVSSVKTKLAELPGKIWSAIIGAKDKIVTWGGQMKTKAVEAAQKVFDGIKNKLAELPSEVAKIGGDIVNGLWNGISGLKDWVVSKVSGLGSSILNGVENALGIASPSKEFAEVGKYIMLGWAEGIDDYGSKVTDAIGDTVSDVTGAAEGISSAIGDNLDVNTAISAAGAVSGSDTASTNDLLAQLQTIASKLDNLEQPTNLYVSGKKLASTIAKNTDQSLSTLQRRATI